LSSTPLQTSIVGPIAPTHEPKNPFAHVARPGLQAPTSLPHGSV
jgi:hypothetical protein